MAHPFDELVSVVWSEARQDDGALLATFSGPPSSDRARAERVLGLPHVDRLRERLATSTVTTLGRKDAGRATTALARARQASEDKRDRDAVLALSEAIRFAPCGSEVLVEAMESRAHALLRLGETAASLQDLRRLANWNAATGPTGPPRLRILLATSSCLETQGDGAGAEAVLREAFSLARDLTSAGTAPSSALGDIVQRLKRVSAGAATGTADEPRGQQTSSASSRSGPGSGLDALPKLLGGAHPSLASAAAPLAVRADKKRGLHLVATKPIPAGSVLVVERPYAWSLSAPELSSHCLHCCAPVLAPLPCPRCSTAVFCGEDCLRAALPSYHLAECGVLDALTADGGELSAMALLAFRIVVRATGIADHVAEAVTEAIAEDADTRPTPTTLTLPTSFVDLFGEEAEEAESVTKADRRRTGRATACSATGYGAVFDQVTHSASRTPADLLKRSLTAAFLTCCLEEGLRRRGMSLGEPRGAQAVVLTAAFLRHIQSCSCNAYQISEQRLPGGSVRAARGVELGGACYPTVSLINHACSPNVVRHSHGNVCVVRALRGIPEGGELLDNYGPHFLELEREDRQAALARQYFFECECEACQRDWPTLEDLAVEDAAEDADSSPVGKPRHRGQQASGKRNKSSSGQAQRAELSLLASKLAQGVQGLLEGRPDEALRSALRYVAALERLQADGRPPSRELVRATQVATLCWSLAGNRVDD